MARLQKQLSRKVEGKAYPKYVITLPPKLVNELSWKEGIKLNATAKNGKIILSPDDSENE
jgi:hypothetical protein